MLYLAIQNVHVQPPTLLLESSSTNYWDFKATLRVQFSFFFPSKDWNNSSLLAIFTFLLIIVAIEMTDEHIITHIIQSLEGKEQSKRQQWAYQSQTPHGRVHQLSCWRICQVSLPFLLVCVLNSVWTKLIAAALNGVVICGYSNIW